MLDFKIENGLLYDSDSEQLFAEDPYRYYVETFAGGNYYYEDNISNVKIEQEKEKTTITGLFSESKLEITQVISKDELNLHEKISVKNKNKEPLHLNRIECGFLSNLNSRKNWHLFAIPFRVQLDGSVRDFTGKELIKGHIRNVVYSDVSRCEPAMRWENGLYSEAWGWWDGSNGIVMMKYNNENIEYSVACPSKIRNIPFLRFGGVAFSLYGEPSNARVIEPGQTIDFGVTIFSLFQENIANAFKCYKSLLDSKGHDIPINYNPPINWNVLYDIGWHHSDKQKLEKCYTKKTILDEAQKANECGCELLYLDPGWEIAEGTTLWDKDRLGETCDLVKVLKEEYDLDLGFRTILRCHVNSWPENFLVKHSEAEEPGTVYDNYQKMWELCLCSKSFWQEKLSRILEITKAGMKFIMFDEMDWRGPCYDNTHEHKVPTNAQDHVEAVYSLCKEVRKQYPNVTIEAHDPVWPWRSSVYVPVYFKQGFGSQGCYQENWGFEYMWDCLNDLKSGKALALYYYNLACSIPLYLHITMAADNDNCIFFWWAASTVRHIGLGGKFGEESVMPSGVPEFDSEKRFANYRKQIGSYKEVRPYFTRGQFHGVAENIHLHTLEDKEGGVVVVFNLSDDENDFEFDIPLPLVNAKKKIKVKGAEAIFADGLISLKLTNVKAMSPSIIYLGDAIVG